MAEPTNQPTDGYLNNEAPYPTDGPGFVGRDQSKHLWKALRTHMKMKAPKMKGIIKPSDVKIKHKKLKYY